LVAWLLWERTKTTRSLTLSNSKLIDVLEKTIVLAQSKGPLEFQAVQAMGMQYPVQEVAYDPSDEAEARRLGEIPPDAKDALNAYERDALDDSFLSDLDFLGR
jgi:hypothetical protein